MTALTPRETACPLCGRPAHFRYANDDERRRGSPLCWGEREQDCPGYERQAERQLREAVALLGGGR